MMYFSTEFILPQKTFYPGLFNFLSYLIVNVSLKAWRVPRLSKLKEPNRKKVPSTFLLKN